ncbi:putative RNA recognition motif domain, nucleotide-binding alpha-beta plait domain superfamily [Helianthus anomalus]
MPYGRQRSNNGGSVDGGTRVPVLKFLVANIPEGCRPWDLAGIFRAHGELAGVYIVRKRDKEGWIFGFVSFKGVRDDMELKRNLKQIKLGGNKLKVNIARFALENENGFNEVGVGSLGRESSKIQQGTFQGGRHDHKRLPVRVANIRENGRSFIDILLNKTCPVLEEETIDIDPSFNTLSGLVRKALVGRTADFKTLGSLNVIL